MTWPFTCATCKATDPEWRILRESDDAVTWTCRDHLAYICRKLQVHGERTRLIVTANPREQV